ncbi:hypothetical protein B0H13DRAFT_1877211 [Mycena leptocephala]|nr:hypothetical protein B0H13DRAFT_1885730 [Mycena leptocephala]KAJ7910023.1 hypothetical protein B0H13DRAFT_1877211 [Mycena leptocephala]
MTSHSQFTGLTPKQVEFCDQFPDGRLCRFINRRSGTLLDVRPNLTLVDDEVPQVVGKPSLEPGNAETFGVQYWIIKPHGNGQAIIPVPKDGSSTVMYLTASGLLLTVAVTVSPFPVSWVIIPTSDSPTSPPLTGSTVPPGLTEEWTAQICWPHSNNDVPRLLDLYAGNPAPDTNVVIYPYGATQQQFWRIQFLQCQSTAHCGRIKSMSSELALLQERLHSNIQGEAWNEEYVSIILNCEQCRRCTRNASAPTVLRTRSNRQGFEIHAFLLELAKKLE